MDKISKAEALYFPPTVLNPGESPTGASCGKCALRCTTRLGEECAIVFIDGTADTRVSFKKGVCGLYVGGCRELIGEPLPSVPRSVAGYYEGAGVPTHCGNCRHYQDSGDFANGTCAKVSGPVKFWGCSNLWEAKHGN